MGFQPKKIRDRVRYNPGFVVLVGFLFLLLCGVLFWASPLAGSLYVFWKFSVAGVLVIAAAATRLGSNKLCAVEVNENGISGTSFRGKHVEFRWSGVRKVVFRENCIEITTPDKYVAIGSSFIRFPEIINLARGYCSREGIECVNS